MTASENILAASPIRHHMNADARGVIPGVAE